jgi:G3E family GTPase
LVMKAEDDIVEMNNGCLCCTLNDNLYEILHQLWERRANWNELLIETTGIADPAGVALPFLADPGFQKQFPLKRVICLVDAERIEEQLVEHTEARKQLTFADIVLIHKSDRISPEYALELKAKLQKINPFANFYLSKQGAEPIAELFAHERNQLAELKAKEQEQVSKHHHHHQHSDISSLSFRFKEPIDIKKLQARLMAFFLFQASDIYRVKGIIYDQNHPHRFILQSVGNNMSIAGGSKWKDDEDRLSRIVIIGKNLTESGYQKMLEDCLDN